MKSLQRPALIFALLVPLVALLPLVRIGAEWLRFAALTDSDAVQTSLQGYDWVSWEEKDGGIRAGYVLPKGPAWEAGLRSGDLFYEFNYQQYFNVGDLLHAIEGAAPGSINTYSVSRGDELIEAAVQFTRYPTFIYLNTAALWHFSIWGFTVGAFLHAVGLAIAIPLARRSRRAWSTLWLIVISALWFFANLLRLVLIEVFGPPVGPGGIYDVSWQILTVIGLVGWVSFPALLFAKVLRESGFFSLERHRLVRLLIYLPALFVLSVAVASTWFGHFGPFTQAGLIRPILFHTCWYIAAAAFLMLVRRFTVAPSRPPGGDGWSVVGSMSTFALALLASVSASGLLPELEPSSNLGAWLIVGTQLLATAPILLVTIATLKHGKVDRIVTRALTYVVVLGLIFFAFVGGMAFLDPYLDRTGASRNVVAGIYTVLLLLIFERGARLTRVYTSRFFATERQKARQTLSRLHEQLLELASPDTLAQETVRVVGQAFAVRSAALFLKPYGAHGEWVAAGYHPDSPFISVSQFRKIWPFFERGPHIWASNQEINENKLPAVPTRLLEKWDVAIAVPINGQRGALGLLALSSKRLTRSVFNLDDVEMLRALGGQVALAMDRLNLIERTQSLVQETTEAQLVALRAQINPHFLFNALNTIISLIGEKPEEAEETVENLSAIFRHILQTSSLPYVTLEDELTLVGHYLAIEKARFGANLEIDVSIDEASRLTPIPAFTIQTLVENAVKHGLEKRRGPGRLQIRAATAPDGSTDVSVEDNGAGIPLLFGSASRSVETGFFGIGLRNVAARLERLYSRSDLLQITSDPETGTCATVRFPARRSNGPDAQPAILALSEF